MEILFSTEIEQSGQQQHFDVFFEDDRYIFKERNGQETFSIKREADEWHADNRVDPRIREVAIQKLESYLLSQH